GEARQDKILRGAESQLAAQFRPLEVALDAAVHLQDVAREAQHRLTIRRQRHGMGVARDEPSADRLLQLAHMLAHRRLADGEKAPRTGEAARLGDSREGAQEDGIVHGYLVSRWLISASAQFQII